MPKNHPTDSKEPAPKTIKRAPKATRKQTNSEGRKWNGQEGGGPGRPKGSTLDPRWKLTPNQMDLAERILTVETDDGFFPASIAELAHKVGSDRQYVREMLRRDNFQAYINHMLLSDGIMLEMSFWRGMQLGLQVGDPKVLQLYANMTGKITKREMPTIKVELIAPDGSRQSLPMYTDDIIDAEIIEDEIDETE